MQNEVLLTSIIIVLFIWPKPLICGAHHGRTAIMKVRTCPACGERWWCVKCGYCHWCHPDFEPPAGVAVMPRGGSPTLPSRAVDLPFLPRAFDLPCRGHG